MNPHGPPSHGVAPLAGPRIVLAAYDLALDLFQISATFPRNRQRSLGGRLESAALASRIDELGRMLGGWRKWSRAGGRDETGR